MQVMQVMQVIKDWSIRRIGLIDTFLLFVTSKGAAGKPADCVI